MVHAIFRVKRYEDAMMRPEKDFPEEEYEKLIELLGLGDNSLETVDKSEFFNAWNFGLKEEDCEFILSTSL